MIEINLLPEEIRKKNKPAFKIDIEMGKVKFIAAGIVLGLISLLILFSIGSCVRKKQILNLMAKKQTLSSQSSEIEIIDKNINALNTKIALLNQIVSRDFLWAAKLNQLSDLILPGIWFTRLYIISNDSMVIEGSAISKQEEAVALVGKFIRKIKEDAVFFDSFENIKLESVQRKSTEGKDIVDFKIVVYLKG